MHQVLEVETPAKSLEFHEDVYSITNLTNSQYFYHCYLVYKEWYHTRVSHREFKELIKRFYREKGRDLPWRHPDSSGFDPYKILVSEIMLQQTQVSRVIDKYHTFLEIFPTVATLGTADLGDVLRVWNGLGYNRRAKYLWQAAGMVSGDFQGVFPTDVSELTKLPGVGTNTAGAICVYAYNQPELFIETNVRTVYIHHFFEDAAVVADAEITPLLAATLDRTNPREFYWGLMDYGSHLKKEVGNATRRSKHFTIQSTFEGSRRQIRGAVLRYLKERACTSNQLHQYISDQRLDSVLDDLVHEGLVIKTGRTYRL